VFSGNEPVAAMRRHNEYGHLNVLDGVTADHEAAVRVWRAANTARLLPPSVERVARIWEKLAEPEACLVIVRHDLSGDVLAMALAEPGRARLGAGAATAGYGHVVHGLHPPRRVGTGCRPTADAGTSRACIGKRLEPYDVVDPGVERARSTLIRSPGIPRVRP